MKKTIALLFSLTVLFGTVFTSCSEEEISKTENYNEYGEYIGENPYVLVMAYAPAEGYDYSYYPVQFEDLMKDTVLSAVGLGSITQVGYFEYTQVNNVIYSTGGLGYTDLSAIKKEADGELKENPFGVNFTNSIADFVSTEDGNLLGLEMSTSSDVVVLHLIDKETNALKTSTTTSCYLINPVMDEQHLPHNTGLVQSGDYVYLSYYIFGPSYTSPYTDSAEVAVFTYPELEYVKTIKDGRTGPIGGWATNSGLFKDDTGDVYALSHTNRANGYSQSNPTAGFLRINKNEVDFDSNYFFDLTKTGEGYTTANALYLGGSKVYAEMNVKFRSEQTAWSDGPLKPAVIDLSAKSVNYFEGCPEHFGPGRDIESIALYDDAYIYNPITTENGIYIYRMNTADMSVTRGAKVNASFVAGTFRLN